MDNFNNHMLKKYESELTTKLDIMRENVLKIYGKYISTEGLNRPWNIHSLHGLIGSKNNEFVDSIRMQFVDPKDFIAKWIKGLIRQYGDKTYYREDGTARKYILIDLLKDEDFREYTFTFLERNFYRNFIERTRFKPSENLWKIWFGNGNLVWGLVISPAYRKGCWTNDVSEIRRARYKYWTIGHIMKTGILDPESEDIFTFSNYSEFLAFYKSILKRVSNSLYEKEIFERYINYLKKSVNIDDEPFLIPELRYAGLEKEHKFRLDFTVLNPHTQEFIGFELSPHSTHMSISGIKSKTQIQMNEELCNQWAKEMKKRNEYFSQYGITTITFTDDDLADIDNCFNKIMEFLASRSEEQIDLDDQIEKLMAI